MGKAKAKAPTAAEQRYIDKAKELGCLCCAIDAYRVGAPDPHTPAIWAHFHEEEGKSQRSPHTVGAPLCSNHHDQAFTTAGGVPNHHGTPALFAKIYGGWKWLLNQQNLRMMLAYYR